MIGLFYFEEKPWPNCERFVLLGKSNWVTSRNFTAEECLVDVQWPKIEFRKLSEAPNLEDTPEEFTRLNGVLLFESKDEIKVKLKLSQYLQETDAVNSGVSEEAKKKRREKNRKRYSLEFVTEKLKKPPPKKKELKRKEVKTTASKKRDAKLRDNILKVRGVTSEADSEGGNTEDSEMRNSPAKKKKTKKKQSPMLSAEEENSESDSLPKSPKKRNRNKKGGDKPVHESYEQEGTLSTELVNNSDLDSINSSPKKKKKKRTPQQRVTQEVSDEELQSSPRRNAEDFYNQIDHGTCIREQKMLKQKVMDLQAVVARNDYEKLQLKREKKLLQIGWDETKAHNETLQKQLAKVEVRKRSQSVESEGSDDEDIKKRKYTSRDVVKRRSNPEPLKIAEGDSSKYDLGHNVLIEKEKVDKIVLSTSFNNYVGKLMCSLYDKEPDEELVKYSWTGASPKKKAKDKVTNLPKKKQFPINIVNALKDAAEKKFHCDEAQMKAAVISRLNRAHVNTIKKIVSEPE